MSKRCFSIALLTVALVVSAACNAHDRSGDSTAIDAEVASEPGDDTDGIDDVEQILVDITPCQFDVLYLSESKRDIIAGDADQPACFFSVGFAEFDPGSGELMEMISAGDSLAVYEASGFMIARVDFTCNSNSSGVCSADTGTVSVVEFEPTIDDVRQGNLSGRHVTFNLDAEGTKPGHRARFTGDIEGTIP
jgi:hypothetical protein